MPLQHCFDDLAFRDEPVPHPGREGRHVRAIPRAPVGVALGGIGATGTRNEVGEPGEPGLARRLESHALIVRQ